MKGKTKAPGNGRTQFTPLLMANALNRCQEEAPDATAAPQLSVLQRLSIHSWLHAEMLQTWRWKHGSNKYSFYKTNHYELIEYIIEYIVNTLSSNACEKKGEGERDGRSVVKPWLKHCPNTVEQLVPFSQLLSEPTLLCPAINQLQLWLHSSRRCEADLTKWYKIEPIEIKFKLNSN